MHLEEVVDICAKGNGDSEGVDEFAGVFAYAFGTEDGSVRGGINFDVAVFGFHKNRFSVVVEGEVSGEVVDASVLEL